MTQLPYSSISFQRRLSWRSAKIAVILTLLVGTFLAAIQVLGDIKNERQRIQDFSNETLIALKEQASRAAYRLDTTVAQDITNGLLSFQGVEEARLIDDFGDILAVSSRDIEKSEIGFVDQWLGTQRIESKEDLYIKSGQAVGRLEIDMIPAASAPGFAQRTYGLVMLGFMKGFLLSIVLTIAFHMLISRRILQAATSYMTKPQDVMVPSDDQDEIDALLGQIRSWNEELEKARALKNRHNDWFQLAAKSAGIGFWEWNVTTNKLSWDDNMMDIYEVNHKNFGGEYEDWLACIHPEDRPKINQNIQDFVAGKRPYNTEFRIITQPWNTVKHIMADGIILRDEAGQMTSVIGINRDVSARKNLEEKLVKSQHMQAIAKLTGGIAHDLNNSLQAISANVEFLRRYGQQVPGNEKYLSVIERSTEKSSTLIKSLLAFSRKQTLSLQPIEINSTLQSMTEVIKQTLGPNIQYYFFGDIGSSIVMIDEIRFKEVILNIMINAREAIERNGTVNVKVFRKTDYHAVLNKTDRGAKGPQDYFEICINDTGHGIETDHLDQVFDPFFTTKSFGQGSGLGLSIAYGFVKQCEGDIKVESCAETGTTIKLIFPEAQQDQKAHLLTYLERKSLKQVAQ